MTVDIFYHQYSGASDILECWDSPLSVDGVGIEPTRSIDDYKPNSVPHYMCPAWRHKQQREFIVYAPRDLTIEATEEGIRCPNIDTPELMQRLVKIEDFYPPVRTLQIACPMMVVWTSARKVWVEATDHPLTALNNNYTLVNGWFNLSEWARPISLGVMRVDIDKPVVIKRGDPLYKLRFFQENNLKQEFNMIKSEPPEKLVKDMHNRLSVKNLIPFISKDLIFGKDKERKCPFGFGK